MSSPYLKLPFSFDVARLQKDLDHCLAAAWIEHFNTQAYEHGWSCLPLRSVGGSVDSIMPLEGADFHDTVHLQACAYFRRVIDSFPCEKTSVRLMALAPGGIIKEHRDDKSSMEDGITRLHIPIQTTPDVLFRIDGEDMHFSAGDTWYLNASCRHGVVNPGAQARVHLMLDCVTNPWLADVFRRSGGRVRNTNPYPDATVHAGNVVEVIAQLRAAGHAGGLQMAAELERIHAEQQATQQTQTSVGIAHSAAHLA